MQDAIRGIVDLAPSQEVLGAVLGKVNGVGELERKIAPALRAYAATDSLIDEAVLVDMERFASEALRKSVLVDAKLLGDVARTSIPNVAAALEVLADVSRHNAAQNPATLEVAATATVEVTLSAEAAVISEEMRGDAERRTNVLTDPSHRVGLVALVLTMYSVVRDVVEDSPMEVARNLAWGLALVLVVLMLVPKED